MLTREKLVLEVENEIITGLITSTTFAKQAIPLIRKELLEGELAKIVFDWCCEYLKKYKEAPNREITQVYKEKSRKLDEDKAELVSEFLANLSDRYDSSFNVPYRVDQTREYMDKRGMIIHAENLQRCIEMENFEKFKAEIAAYRDVAKTTLGFQNPLDKRLIRQDFLEEDDEDELFSLPGALGKFAGPECRGYLIAVLGPMKRGKSFFAQEFMIEGAKKNRKAVFFSLEMSEKRVRKRITKSLFAYGKQEGNYKYPTFDCAKNQNGSCKNPLRKNKIRLLNKDGSKPDYTSELRYRPCTVCRENNRAEFITATWYKTLKIEKPTASKISKKADNVMRMYGDNLRIKAIPANTLTVDMIKAELDQLKYAENFEADIVVVDYPKLMKPERPGLSTIESIDATWIALKGLASARKVCIVAPTQGTRASIAKRNVHQRDIAGYIDILAHVDKMYAINQTPSEKEQGIMRISVIAHRDEDFNEERDIIILQQRGTGQTILDSEFADSYSPTQES